MKSNWSFELYTLIREFCIILFAHTINHHVICVGLQLHSYGKFLALTQNHTADFFLTFIRACVPYHVSKDHQKKVKISHRCFSSRVLYPDKAGFPSQEIFWTRGKVALWDPWTLRDPEADRWNPGPGLGVRSLE